MNWDNGFCRFPERSSCPSFFSGVASLAPAHKGLRKVVSPFDGHSVVRERKISLSSSHKEQCEKSKLFLTYEIFFKIISGKEKARRFFSGEKKNGAGFYADAAF